MASKARKNQAAKKTTADRTNTTKATSKKRPASNDENDPNPRQAKRSNTGGRLPAGTAHPNSGESVNGIEGQMSRDEMMQKYAELQGQIDISLDTERNSHGLLPR
jgi:hypothetical protein